MPIATFHNDEDRVLEFVVEPAADRYEIPYLATLGIRYQLKPGAEDRSSAIVSSDGIAFWCDDERYEIDVVHPTAYDLLTWEVCAKLGFCGGFRGEEHITIRKLLPKAGLVSATDYALLVLAAEMEGCAKTEGQRLRWQKMLEDAFVRRLGPDPVEASSLQSSFAAPFDGDAPRDQGIA